VEWVGVEWVGVEWVGVDADADDDERDGSMIVVIPPPMTFNPSGYLAPWSGWC